MSKHRTSVVPARVDRVYETALDADTTGVHRRAEVPTPRASGSVLIVTDESLLAGMFQRVLRAHGYGVLVAESERAAAAMIVARRSRLAAVLVDHALPHDAYAALMASLERLAPTLPVIVAAPYDPRGEGATPRSAVFLAKPFSLAGLLDAVDEARGLDVAAPCG